MPNRQQKSQISPQRPKSIKVRLPNSPILPSDFFRRSASQSPTKENCKPSPETPTRIKQKEPKQSAKIPDQRYWDSMREQIQENCSIKENIRITKRYSGHSEKRNRKTVDISHKTESAPNKVKVTCSGNQKEPKISNQYQLLEYGLFTFSGNSNNKIFQIHLPAIK